jgi:hypothetical protein
MDENPNSGLQLQTVMDKTQLAKAEPFRRRLPYKVGRAANSKRFEGDLIARVIERELELFDLFVSSMLVAMSAKLG